MHAHPIPALVLFLLTGLPGLVRILPASGQAPPATLSFAERDALQNNWLKQRFDTILPDMQDGVPGMGDLPLIDDTVWAVELGVSVAIPEWGGDRLQVALEEDAVFTRTGGRFLDGRQTRFHLVGPRS